MTSKGSFQPKAFYDSMILKISTRLLVGLCPVRLILKKQLLCHHVHCSFSRSGYITSILEVFSKTGEIWCGAVFIEVLSKREVSCQAPW